MEEISKEDSEDESYLQVCSVRRPHLLTMIVSIVEKSVKEQDDDDVDHGDIVVGDDRDNRDVDESFFLSGIFFSNNCDYLSCEAATIFDMKLTS